ncbi:unnamed protein product [Sphagnum jensenii]|uniref:Uncharacterized protein n=1 Tax=Sphagnum jensenii TaxID=128206 RepID=A0ABP0W1Q0_9BRYO
MGSMADKGAGSAVEAMTVSVTDKTTPAAWHGIIEIHTRGDSNKTDSRESLSPYRGRAGLTKLPFTRLATRPLTASGVGATSDGSGRQGDDQAPVTV